MYNCHGIPASSKGYAMVSYMPFFGGVWEVGAIQQPLEGVGTVDPGLKHRFY